jgi:cysteinyl-tRNA synthetase
MNATEAGALLDAINRIDSVLGVLETTGQEVPDKIKTLAEKRKAAKLNKDWKAADAVRAEILAEGWIVEDTAGGGYRIKHREEAK